jgi:hypothetical protein
MGKEKPEQTQVSQGKVDEAVAGEKPVDEIQAANMQRRRVLLAGLAAVPVLVTLKSRSAFAVDDALCSKLLSITVESANPGAINPADEQACQELEHPPT